jgi:TolA-binding protein
MLMKQLFSSALVIAVLACPAVPAYAADKEVRQMMADIRMLQEQSQELQNLLGQLTEALKGVNTRIDQQTESGRKSFADQKVAIDGVSGDLRVVRERMDDNGVRIGSLTQEVDALRQTVMQINVPSQAAVSLPETTAPDSSAGVPSPGAAPPPAASRTPAIGAGLSPKAAYEQAMADYYIAQYDLAIAGLEAYIRAFPRSEQADEAQVNIGNSWLQLNKYDKAVEAYDLAIRTYPKGNATPEAYLKKGISLAGLKRTDEARSALEFVTTNFPNSFEATLAKQTLEKLSAGAPAPATRKP